MTSKDGSEAGLSCTGMGKKGRKVPVKEAVYKEVIKAAVSMLNIGKALRVDGKTAEILKSGIDVVAEWMHKTCVRGKMGGCQMNGLVQ